jgi:PKD repeat protein
MKGRDVKRPISRTITFLLLSFVIYAYLLLIPSNIQTVFAQTTGQEYHWLESEYPSSFTSPFTKANDQKASNSQYLYAPNGSGSNATATYTVTISTAGQYILWGRVLAINGEDDSFFVNIDGGTDNLWDVQRGSSWVWDQVYNRGGANPTVFTLSAGVHTIRVKQREDGTKVDKLLLTNNRSYTPSGVGSPAENINPPANTSPIVNAGNDQTITLPANATLNATVSDDGLPSGALTYTWSKVSGPGTATFANPNAEDTTVVFSINGTYVLQLQVNDGALSATDTVTVTVNPASQGGFNFSDNFNRSASGNLGSNWSEVAGDMKIETNQVHYNSFPKTAIAILSSNPAISNGTITFDWNFERSGYSYGGMVFRYVDLGNYYYVRAYKYSNQLELKKVVNNSTVSIATVPCTFNVTSTYALKVVMSGTSIKVYVNNSLYINATDGTFTKGNVGIYMLRNGASTGKGDNFTVNGSVVVNIAPIVNVGSDQTITLPANATLNATVSDDGLPNGTLTYAWSQVSGPGIATFANLNTEDTTVSFPAAGTYALLLSVSDGALNATDTVSVIVIEAPVAAFNANSTSGIIPFTVNFTDRSTGQIDTWSWDFGDGSPVSNEQNPSHEYGVAGDYTVTLTVTGPGGTDAFTATNFINAQLPPPPYAEFSGNPTVGEVPLTVVFTDHSTGQINTWEWDFGDGSPVSNEQNPTHEYTAPGYYSPTLTLTGPGGTHPATKVDYIDVQLPPAPVAAFVADQTTGIIPLTVNFTDQSTGLIDVWQWDFGDGSPVSNEQNPSHEYTTAGSYTVVLTVTGPGGTNTFTASYYINAQAPTPPYAQFSGTPTTGVAPLTVVFTDYSTGKIDTWEWDFGDGSPVSNVQNPTHEYTTAGNYTVMLTVTGPGGTNTFTASNYINAQLPPAPVADFTADQTTGQVPLTINFTDQSTGQIDTWAWNFGDGSPVSNVQNPTHEYTTAGNYTVTLTVTGLGGTDMESITVNPVSGGGFTDYTQESTCILAITADETGDDNAIAHDASTYGSNGTVINAQRVEGMRGYCYQFDGNGDYIDLGSTTTFNTKTGAMTLVAWVRLEAAPASADYRVISKSGPSGYRGWDLKAERGGTNGSYWSVGVATSSTSAVGTGDYGGPVAQGTWYHLAGVYVPGTELRMYVNGVLVKTNSTGIPATMYVPSREPRIGARSDGLFFNGKLDDVAIFDTALSQDDIQDIMNYGLKGELGIVYPPPNVPVVTNWPTATLSTNTITLTGTKDPDTSIWINNVLAVARDASTDWSYNFTLQNGDNTIEIFACNAALVSSATTSGTIHYISNQDLLDLMHAKAARYAFEQRYANGLIFDISNETIKSSIAATGFGLGALISAHSRYGSTPNWDMHPQDIEAHVNTLLDTLIFIQNNQAGNQAVYGTRGFFYHFIKGDMTRWTPNPPSEVSAIDNAILIAGLMLTREYFQSNPNIYTKIASILSRIDWALFYDATNDQFHQSWTPESGVNPETIEGYYNSSELLLISLMSYIQNPSDANYMNTLFDFPRPLGFYSGYPVYHTFYGSLFSYFFAHCFFDLKGLGPDDPGRVGANVPQVDWWLNSRNAALANRQFCINNAATYSSYGPDCWGLSASLRPDGAYKGDYGARPCYANGGNAIHDGTVNTTAAAACMPFVANPGEDLGDNFSMRVIRHLYDRFRVAAFDYSAFNSLNEVTTKTVGIEILPAAMMIENYRSGLLWDTLMQSPQVDTALREIFTYAPGETTILNDLKIEAEHFTTKSGGVLDWKTNASAQVTLGGGWGKSPVDFAAYQVSLEEASELLFRLRYSHDAGYSKIRVYFDNQFKGAFIPKELGGAWNTFAWGEPIALGAITKGVHEIKIMAEYSSYGVNLDVFTLRDPSLSSVVINSVTPGDGTAYDSSASSVMVQVDAVSSEGGALEYQFTVNGVVRQVWSSSNTFDAMPYLTQPGLYKIVVEVRDSAFKLDARTIEYYLYRDPIPLPGS